MRSALIFALALVSWQTRPAAPPERATSAFSEDKARRFDFWIGTWDVNLRMLQDDGTFRDSVRARANIYPILEGRAILELWDSEPIVGLSLRYYDPASDLWELWLDWPSENRSRTSKLTGSFRHGRGDFYAEREREDGTTVRFRYSFNDITPFSLRWDDHFSEDGGRTWRPNWIMEFTRTGLEPEWPIPHERTPTFHAGGRCTLESFRPYEALEGDWSGSLELPGARELATLSAYRVLDGCALVVFLSTPSRSRFALLSFDTARDAWELDWLTSASGTKLERFFGKESFRRVDAEGARFTWALDGDRLSYELARDGELEWAVFERR